MKCLACKKEAIERNGKFGVFYFCPGHGTFSQQGSKVTATGAMVEKLRQRIEELRKISEPIVPMAAPSIDFAVRRGMADMGFFMNDMDHFIEGGREAAMDEGDHWMNTPQR
jgi:hypothetical protein